MAGSVIYLPRWRILRPTCPGTHYGVSESEWRPVPGTRGRWEVLEFESNMLLYPGARAAWSLLIAEDDAPDPFSNSNAYIAVGNGGTVPDPSQTGLMGTSTARRPMEATYPRHTSVNGEPAAVIVFRAAFPDGVAEFHWNEIGLANSSSGPILFNRRTRDIGDKPAGVPSPGWVTDLIFQIQPAPGAS